MGNYGLSADVYNLYSLSWHGVDVTVYKANWPTIWHERAVCTDCHGVHDILPTTDPASTRQPGQPADDLPPVPPGRRPQLDWRLDRALPGQPGAHALRLLHPGLL